MQTTFHPIKLELVLESPGSELLQAGRIILCEKLDSLELQLQNLKRSEPAQQLRSPRLVLRYKEAQSAVVHRSKMPKNPTEPKTPLARVLPPSVSPSSTSTPATLRRSGRSLQSSLFQEAMN